MTISRENLAEAIAKGIEESKKENTAVSLSAKNLFHMVVGLIVAAMFAIGWNVPHRVTQNEFSLSSLFKAQEEARQEQKEFQSVNKITNERILDALNNIERTRFTPEDFAVKIQPLNTRMLDLEREDERQWDRINKFENLMAEINKTLQRLVIKAEQNSSK